MKRKLKKIAMIGLGYVGLPLSVEFGKIRSVIGFDVNLQRVRELLEGTDVTSECTSEDLTAASHLTFTSELSKIADADIYIVTVPTPIDKLKRPDLSPLKKACQTVGKVLSTGNIVIFESTVYPGATEEVCVPILEEVSSLQFNSEFFVGYSPERINPGDKVHTLTKIVKITSGSTKKVSEEIDQMYRSIISAGTYRAPSMRVAEAAKVIENAQRDLNIAFMNELSIIFDRLEIDTLQVLEAAGSKWNFLPFRPGMVGGHCIGVDPYYLSHKAEEVGYIPEIISAARRVNESMGKFVAESLIKRMLRGNIDLPKSTIGVLGVTFKDNCPDIRNSKVFDLISELKSWNVDVIVHDPWANKQEVKKEYGVTLCDISDFNELDALVVAVSHDLFRQMSTQDLSSMLKSDNAVIGDIKSIYNKLELESLGFDVFKL
jgi:UDP-N-acetyl-D-galactosamine dehydrogenase